MLNSEQIQQILPHRYPFLLVDRVLEMEEGRRVVAVKNVTANEPFFQGHFPGRPIMPGVLIVEALAQTGAVAILSLPENKGKIVLFAGIEDFRFRKMVTPGDTLRLEVTMDKLHRAFGRSTAVATVEGEVAAEGKLLFVVSKES